MIYYCKVGFGFIKKSVFDLRQRSSSFTTVVPKKTVLKLFNAHLNLYDKFNPEHPLPVKHQPAAPFLILPKAHKLTSKNIIYLCLKNQMSYKLERRKKKTVNVSTIEMNLSKLAKPVSLKETDIKKQYNKHRLCTSVLVPVQDVSSVVDLVSGSKLSTVFLNLPHNFKVSYVLGQGCISINDL
ncbi:hypothetical protein BDF21DRAFT_396173 [Thamnidium elegans]|nr:hypothetical protein BDF21DRAFT_396173 [Thamnidium elegans]